jgi:hypothetical protein
MVATLEKAPLSGGLKSLVSFVIQQMPALKKEEVENILRALFSLSVLVTDEDTPLSESLSSLSSAMQASGNPELVLSDQERSDFEKKLERLLKINSVGVVSKVRRLGLEYPNTFHGAMILSDMRPIFDKPDVRPVGCTISHTLQITYHEGDEHKEFYVILDDDDIKTMKKVLQRAETKSSSLKSLLKSANLPDLS